MNPFGISRPTPVHSASRAAAVPPRAAAAPPPRVRVTYLSVAAIADELDVSKMTVYRLIHGGELNALRVGRSFRVTETELDRYLKAAES